MCLLDPIFLTETVRWYICYLLFLPILYSLCNECHDFTWCPMLVSLSHWSVKANGKSTPLADVEVSEISVASGHFIKSWMGSNHARKVSSSSSPAIYLKPYERSPNPHQKMTTPSSPCSRRKTPRTANWSGKSMPGKPSRRRSRAASAASAWTQQFMTCMTAFNWRSPALMPPLHSQNSLVFGEPWRRF